MLQAAPATSSAPVPNAWDELFAKTIEAMRSCEDAVNAEMEA